MYVVIHKAKSGLLSLAFEDPLKLVPLMCAALFPLHPKSPSILPAPALTQLVAPATPASHRRTGGVG